MSTILDKIVLQTKEDLSKRKRKASLLDFESFEGFEKSRISFKNALQKQDEVNIIAEVKKGSPSKGVIRDDFNPIKIADQYIENGASAISVLTDEPFFMGSLEYLDQISKISAVPLLRKDFLVDPYQVKEAKAFGADAVLIIVNIVLDTQMNELLSAAKEFGLDALVECYDEADFDRVDFSKVDILGVNNRDLKTFAVDVHRGISLLKKAPSGTTLVSESGLSSVQDMQLLFDNGIHSALMGEYFMKQDNPGKVLKDLLNGTKHAIQVNRD